ncbi:MULTISPECIES: hypothetical protein [unclassified Kitasatospora]|uniref:hypothetical protein n=1 Tax=unclassified Kitasatospora TaxID=2633591 RepID=UPI00340088EF
MRSAIWLRWTGHDGIRTLHHGASLTRGWTEKDVDARIVVEAGPDGRPVVHAEAWQAASPLHAVLAQHPADDD